MASVQGGFHAWAELGLGIRQSVLCKGRDFAAPQPLPLSHHRVLSQVPSGSRECLTGDQRHKKFGAVPLCHDP